MSRILQIKIAVFFLDIYTHIYTYSNLKYLRVARVDDSSISLSTTFPGRECDFMIFWLFLVLLRFSVFYNNTKEFNPPDQPCSARSRRGCCFAIGATFLLKKLHIFETLWQPHYSVMFMFVSYQWWQFARFCILLHIWNYMIKNCINHSRNQHNILKWTARRNNAKLSIVGQLSL